MEGSGELCRNSLQQTLNLNVDQSVLCNVVNYVIANRLNVKNVSVCTIFEFNDRYLDKSRYLSN